MRITNKFISNYDFFSSQKGDINWTLIIFVIIFAFAFMIAGASIFFRGQAPSIDNGSEIVPLSIFEGIPTTTNLWSLTVTPGITPLPCKVINGDTFGSFKVNAVGPTTGYIMLELALTSGGYEKKFTRAFVDTTGTTYEFLLPNVVHNLFPNKFGYDKSSWRVRLFEGGEKVGFNYTGGIQRATLVNNPTSCLP